jgi:predicted dehydrogenase
MSSNTSPLGVVLHYTPSTIVQTAQPQPRRVRRTPRESMTVNVIGAGSFAQRILIPALREASFRLGGVASAAGLSAHAAAERFAFARLGTPADLITDDGADLIAVATRHSSHAALSEAALRAGKSVFVEKPPCLSRLELSSLRAARALADTPLVVGFNRRHAPHAIAFRDHLRGAAAPIDIVYRVNAGRLPSEHWLNDPLEGGGRLIGEACHFIDFVCWVAGSCPSGVRCAMRGERDQPLAASQRFTIIVEFSNGSLATIIYTDQGAGGEGKEYVEGHSGGRSALIDDFERLTLRQGGKSERRRGRQNKGHREQFVDLHESLAGRANAWPDPDPLDSMSATLCALEDAMQRAGAAPDAELNSAGLG